MINHLYTLDIQDIADMHITIDIVYCRKDCDTIVLSYHSPLQVTLYIVKKKKVLLIVWSLLRLFESSVASVLSFRSKAGSGENLAVV